MVIIWKGGVRLKLDVQGQEGGRILDVTGQGDGGSWKLDNFHVSSLGVISGNRKATMIISWFIININKIQILSLLRLIKISKKLMAFLLYSIVNWIDGFTEFNILCKSLGLILFSSNKVSQSSRKRPQFYFTPVKVKFPKSFSNLFLQRL